MFWNAAWGHCGAEIRTASSGLRAFAQSDLLRQKLSPAVVDLAATLRVKTLRRIAGLNLRLIR